MTQDNLYDRALDKFKKNMQVEVVEFLKERFEYYETFVQRVVKNDIEIWWNDYAGGNKNDIPDLFKTTSENLKHLDKIFNQFYQTCGSEQFRDYFNTVNMHQVQDEEVFKLILLVASKSPSDEDYYRLVKELFYKPEFRSHLAGCIQQGDELLIKNLKEFNGIYDNMSDNREEVEGCIKKMLNFWILQLDKSTNELRLAAFKSDILGDTWKEQVVKNIFAMPYGKGSSGFSARSKTFLCMRNSFKDAKGAVALEDLIFKNYSYMALPIYEGNELICIIAMFFPVPDVWCLEHLKDQCLTRKLIEDTEILEDIKRKCKCLYRRFIEVAQDAELELCGARTAFIRKDYNDAYSELINMGRKSMEDRYNKKWWNGIINTLIPGSNTKDPLKLGFASIFVTDDKYNLKGIVADYNYDSLASHTKNVYTSICYGKSFLKDKLPADHNPTRYMPYNFDEYGNEAIDSWFRNLCSFTGSNGCYYIPIGDSETVFTKIDCANEIELHADWVDSLKKLHQLINWLRKHISDDTDGNNIVYIKPARAFESVVASQYVKSLLWEEYSILGILHQSTAKNMFNSIVDFLEESLKQELWERFDDFVKSAIYLKKKLWEGHSEESNKRIIDSIVSISVFLKDWEEQYMLQSNSLQVHVTEGDKTDKNLSRDWVMTELLDFSLEGLMRVINSAVKNCHYLNPISLGQQPVTDDAIGEFLTLDKLGFSQLEVFEGRNEEETVYSICYTGKPEDFEKYRDEMQQVLMRHNNSEREFNTLNKVVKDINMSYILAAWKKENRHIPFAVGFNPQYLNNRLEQLISEWNIPSVKRASLKIPGYFNTVTSNGIGARLYSNGKTDEDADSRKYLDTFFHIGCDSDKAEGIYNVIDVFGLSHVKALPLIDKEGRLIGVINLGSSYFNPDTHFVSSNESIIKSQFDIEDIKSLLDGFRQLCEGQLISVIDRYRFEQKLKFTVSRTAHDFRGKFREFAGLIEALCRGETILSLSRSQLAYEGYLELVDLNNYLLEVNFGYPEHPTSVDDFAGFVTECLDERQNKEKVKYNLEINPEEFGKIKIPMNSIKSILKELYANGVKHGKHQYGVTFEIKRCSAPNGDPLIRIRQTNIRKPRGPKDSHGVGLLHIKDLLEANCGSADLRDNFESDDRECEIEINFNLMQYLQRVKERQKRGE